MKNNKRGKETHPPPHPQSLIFQYSNTSLREIRCAFNLSLIYKKRPEHKANGAK